MELHQWEDDGGLVVDDAEAKRVTPDTEFHDPRHKLCLDQHGFYLAPGPGDRFWIFVPRGQDKDGAPLTWTRPCFTWEARAWREGRFADIARGLQAEGQPVHLAPAQTPRGLWGRAVSAVRRFFSPRGA